MMAGLAALLLTGCANTPDSTWQFSAAPASAKPKQIVAHAAKKTEVQRGDYQLRSGQEDLPALLAFAEAKADAPGREVLQAGRKMVLQDKTVIRGSCWDYANAVFNRAGYDDPKNEREVVFKSNRHGPFAQPHLIKPGDFLSHLNHEYRDGEHSAIFVAWQDYEQQQALMLSYAGEGRAKPARYKTYDLSNVYNIVRARSN